MKSTYNITFPVTFDISLPKFEEGDIKTFEQFCDKKDDFYLVAFEAAASTAKSVAIALALFDGVFDVEQAVHCSRIEDNLQAAEYGKVEGVHDVKETQEKMILSAAKLLVTLTSNK
jgi:ATP synthase F1 complex assembly factor 2